MINISKTLYVGKSTVQNSKLPEAEIIPAGDTKRELSKLDTLTSKHTTVSEIDNIELPGFTVLEATRRYSASPYWKIIDPRGFIATIDTNNISAILSVTGITEGLIQEKCIWGRHDDSTRMVLIPVNTPEYRDAIENTKILDKKINIADVKIGDTVMLRDKTIGMYCGKMSIYGRIRRTTGDFYKPTATLRTHVIQVKDGRYLYGSAASYIVDIIQKSPVEINQDSIIIDMNIDNHEVTSSLHYNDKSVRLISKVAHKPTLMYDEMDKEEAQNIIARGLLRNDCGLILLERNDEKYVADISEYYNNYKFSSAFNVCKVDISNPEKIQFLTKRSFSLAIGTETLDNFTKYYKILKKVKNTIYL